MVIEPFGQPAPGIARRFFSLGVMAGKVFDHIASRHPAGEQAAFAVQPVHVDRPVGHPLEREE